MKRDTHLNIMGRKFAHSQAARLVAIKLALHLQICGWNISRSGLAKIECRVVWVGDFELLYVVRALSGVGIGELFPRNAKKAPVHAVIAKLSEVWGIVRSRR